jgi:hypothetical protein
MQLEINNLDGSIKQDRLIERLDWKKTNEIDNSLTFAISNNKTSALLNMTIYHQSDKVCEALEAVAAK